jgi:hypothetical protein
LLEPQGRQTALTFNKDKAFLEVVMLGEIFFLRLEAIARASKEAAPAKPPRFVPISADALNALRERHLRDNGKNA